MSRGPGFWQRAILAAFDQAESFYLVDMLPDGYTKAQYNAAHRAAQRLNDGERISLWHYTYGTPHVAISRPDATLPKRHGDGGLGVGARRRRLSVGAVADLPQGQHLAVGDGLGDS
jgi:hypothetical protein